MINKIKNILFFQFIALNVCNGQNIETFNLLSERDSTVIEYAHIFLDERLVAYSDESGNFKIDLNQSFNIITIKHLSYQTKKITKNELKQFNTLYMREKENLLEDVVISNKKKLKKHVLLPEKRIKEFFMNGTDVRFPNNFIIAVYVPNEFKKVEYNIKSIVFESRKGSDDPNGKFVPFKVNLMTVDTVSCLPKNKIFDEDLTVGKKENQKLLKVDISSFDINFPKEGIFVVVSLYDQEYYLSNGFTNSPGFGQSQISKNSKFFELHLIKGTDIWKEPFYSQERIQCRNFGIEVVEE